MSWRWFVLYGRRHAWWSWRVMETSVGMMLAWAILLETCWKIMNIHADLQLLLHQIYVASLWRGWPGIFLYSHCVHSLNNYPSGKWICTASWLELGIPVWQSDLSKCNLTNVIKLLRSTRTPYRFDPWGSFLWSKDHNTSTPLLQPIHRPTRTMAQLAG